MKKVVIEKDPFRKIGGNGCIVPIDETMLNYKCKSHRGRSPENKTDALCMIEFRNEITYCKAFLINNKKSGTIIPIILANVIHGPVIHTDEHKSYKKLQSLGYKHGSVTHKYGFVDKISEVHTQAIKVFHNCLKNKIKQRKGIQTEMGIIFLYVFVWKFNNRNERFKKFLNLGKV